MKKINLFVIIVLLLFGFIISFLIFYTAFCNEKASIVSASIKKSTCVIIDAGHGGIDGGAVGLDGTNEKEINLSISLKIKSVLELYGFNVVLTREDDNSIHSDSAVTIRQKKISDIKNREKIIKENPDAIFISIHQNFFADSSVHGAQVFYSKNNKLSSELAQEISNSIVKNIEPENKRQIKKSGTEIYLLYHSTVPSVMVECGFMSNYSDLKKLQNEVYQTKLAVAIAQGIINFCKG